MRIVNQNKETITEYDLTKGCLLTRTIIRPDAIRLGSDIPLLKDGEPVLKDGEPVMTKKRFWATEDYEEVQMYMPFPEKTAEQKIAELKTKLSSTDYKVIKCCECWFSGQELPYDTAALHAERQAIRDEINELEVAACP